MSRAGPTHRRQVPSLKGCLSNGGGRSARSGPEPAYWLLVLRFSPAASMSVAAISTACAGHLLDATPPSLRGRVTLLVAGAPYVPLCAAELLPSYEPAQALFGGHHGLDYVRELVNAPDHGSHPTPASSWNCIPDNTRRRRTPSTPASTPAATTAVLDLCLT
jgi:hypothetical protein